MKVEQSVVENGNVEERAQELIKSASTEIMVLEDKIAEYKEEIKEIKNDVKNEGILLKALNGAIKRYRAIQEGKSKELEITEEDLYLNVLLETV